MHNKPLEELLRYSDVSRLCGRSVIALQRDVKGGIGPRATRLGRQVRFLPEDVRAWLERCAAATPATQRKSKKGKRP
jgi:predicted DNA-binding transcriptional regulator AlpA